MSGYIKGADRNQATLFPESLDDYVTEESAVRVIDVFVDELDLLSLGFKTEPVDTGRPGYHPSTMLKLFIYGYMNRVQSSHRLEREAQRNVELMWLTGRLAPDFKTIADFRRDNGAAIQKVCRQFVVLCRKLELFKDASVRCSGIDLKDTNGLIGPLLLLSAERARLSVAKKSNPTVHRKRPPEGRDLSWPKQKTDYDLVYRSIIDNEASFHMT